MVGIELTLSQQEEKNKSKSYYNIIKRKIGQIKILQIFEVNLMPIIGRVHINKC